mgnify:CR=1 FL=1
MYSKCKHNSGKFMIEKVLYLDEVDPVDFWGVNNSNFEILKNKFPKIKIIARGNEIRAKGEKSLIEYFEYKVNQLIDFIQQYNQLTKSDIEFILEDENYVPTRIQEIKQEDVILFGNNGRPVKARTVNQKKLLSESEDKDLIFAIGPAGTGKTYTAIALAVRALKYREVRRIILTRPAVEAGEHLGFLPGDLKDKLDPYLQPLYDALNDMISIRKLNEFIEDGTVQIAPLAYMRGRTLNDAYVILDEAQNTTFNQLKMFLTRMGKSSKFIVTGDITQIDLPKKETSGLVKSMEILNNIEGISFIHFDNRDIIRHNLVKHIINAYNQFSKEEQDHKTSSYKP